MGTSCRRQHTLYHKPPRNDKTQREKRSKTEKEHAAEDKGNGNSLRPDSLSSRKDRPQRGISSKRRSVLAEGGDRNENPRRSSALSRRLQHRKRKAVRFAHFRNLPTELAEQVLYHLDMHTLLVCQRVNKDIRTVIQNSNILRKILWLESHPRLFPRSCNSKRKDAKARWAPCRCSSDSLATPRVAMNPLLEKLIDRDFPTLQFMTREEFGRGHRAGPTRCAELTNPHPLSLRATNTAKRRIQTPTTAPRHDLIKHGVPKPRKLCVNDVKILFATPKTCLAVLDHFTEEDFHPSWHDMILLQGKEIRDLVIDYNFVEYMSQRADEERMGRYERQHRIVAGSWKGSVTLGEVLEALRERHRDIYMEE